MSTISSRFHGKVALVTGAGQGIGQATALRLAVEGAAVGAMDRNEQTAMATAKAVEELGSRALALVGDVSDFQSVGSCVQHLCSTFGRIDVLVSNAGIDRPGSFMKLTPDDFLAVWKVHLLGAVNCCHACGPIMLEQQGGSVVIVSSIYGKVGSKGEAAYCSAKAGLIGLAKSLAREWGSRGVRVNAVLPGLAETPTIQQFMHQKYKDAIISETALGRSADPAEIAAAIAFLASDDSSFITGTTLEVTGGWNL